MAWIWTGFCMVILSAALKGINPELLEAARVDGASECQVFRGITLPLLLPTIAVVATTIIITALKTFDIVYMMTNGNFGTEVVANRMIKEMFQNGQPRPGQRDRRDPAAGDHPGHGPQHPALPRPGGPPMTVAATKATPAVATATGRRRRFGRVPLHLVIVGLIVLWLIPTIGLLVNSLRPTAEVTQSGWWTAIFKPSQFTLENYTTVLNQSNLGQAFINSLIISVPATIIPVMIAAFAAYAFAWMSFPGRNVLFVVVVGLLVVPLQTTFIPVLQLFGPKGLGIAGTFLAVWLAHTAYGLPFAIFLLRNFMAELPREVFESAYIDGASPVTAFFRLALPDERPGHRGAGDLPVPVRVERPAGRARVPRRRQRGEPAHDGGHREPRQLARQRLAAAGRGGVHLDGRAAAGVLRAPALLRARHRRRVREGIGQGARAR